MAKGIILFGSPGAGTTTLGKELAKRLDYPHFDLDDYHWRWDTKIPYTVLRSKDERTHLIMNALNASQNFIMSGSMWSIRKEFEHMFELALYVTASVKIRSERLRYRSLARWGSRVLAGGDMFEHHEVYRDYYATAEQYDKDESTLSYRKQHEQWIEELPCPVLRVNGEVDVSKNIIWILDQYITT